MEKQLELKNKLLNNEISKKEFLDTLMQLDQATTAHEECFDNIVVLEDTVVRDSFLNSDELDQYNYFLYLRNFYFHSFQNIAVKKSQENIDLAISYLEKAEEIGDKLAKLDPDDYDLFTPYVTATLCYMRNNIEGLHTYLTILEKVTDPEYEEDVHFNRLLIRKLHNNLIKYGFPDYSRDS